mmetsp:Transcript_3718/g.10447  ORF Transcript_3718/g.10447 Transcript_3718/m.10447 type:complete len:502 (-) Transcript_3718:3923-5428(-)
MRLQCCGQQPLIIQAFRVDSSVRRPSDGPYGQIDKALVDLSDSDARVASHARVHGPLRQAGAVDAVVGVRGQRADHVRGVHVLDREGQVQRLEVRQHRLLQPHSGVGQLLVPSTVHLARALDERVPTALSDHHDGVPLLLHERDAVLKYALGVHVHLRKQANVCVARREHRGHRKVPAVAPHKLHQADAVRVAGGLHVGGVDGVPRLRDGRVEAEGLLHHRNVVVDRAGHPDAGTLVPVLQQGLDQAQQALVRAVPAQHEELLHLPGLERLRHLLGCWKAALAREHSAALGVDVLHQLQAQLGPAPGAHDAREAVPDAVDALHAVFVQRVHDAANDHVLPRAEATARQDHCARPWLCTVPVHALPGARLQRLVVGDAAAGVEAIRRGESLHCPRRVVQVASHLLASRIGPPGCEPRGAVVASGGQADHVELPHLVPLAQDVGGDEVPVLLQLAEAVHDLYPDILQRPRGSVRAAAGGPHVEPRDAGQLREREGGKGSSVQL